MKNPLVGSIGFALLAAGAASAADLPLKAPVVAAASPYSWTGFYIGGNAGAASEQQPFATAVPGAPNTLSTIPFDGSLGWGTNLPGASVVGATGGGQIGYNYQFRQFVIGVEADIEYNAATLTNNSAFVSTVPPGTGVIINSLSSKTPWFGTVRGRLGIAALDPSILVYLTGGLAYGQESSSEVMTASLANGTLVEAFPFSTSATKAGYTFGAGCEWMFAPHWSAKAEYLYVNLATNSSQSVATTFLGPSALATDVMSFAASRAELNVFRMGINYKFGG